MHSKIAIGLIFLAVFSILGYFAFTRYWIHRYDDLIARQAGIYQLDKNLVRNIIYEETYFRSGIIGDAGEIGLMQVTPTVAREWAKETGFQSFKQQTEENVVEFLRDPERNIQVGCWYLEELREKYRGYNAEKAMTLAAYNAGASRVEEWTRLAPDASKLTRQEFIERITIPSTRAYVSSILQRYDTENVK